MIKDDFLLSIVTPTFNRAILLKNCFHSLQRQTNRSFEWVIVDDGSTDDTKTVVASFREQAPEMTITYIHKENGGKHTALNASHPYLHGNYVLMLDSDDTLLDTAVNDVFEAWLPYMDRPEIGVVVLLKGKTPDKPVAFVRETGVPVDLLKCERVCVSGSDCCEVLRTELFLKYPFPVFPGEKFISEGVLWKQINQGYRYVYTNKVVYLCDYLEDGLTRSGRAMRIKSPLGGMLNSSLNMDPKSSLKTRIKNGLLYCCYGYFAGMNAKEILNWDRSSRGVKAICLLPGFLQFLLWKRRYSS